ncbi:archaeal proteasome endopeptidase complex subunit alpha, partial [Candidatus Bathyarchaeota archaeon]|nr:archaeal proteasome endopeptidase complex subunit alpha [Candidatus Bathyarchaeota archaeon]
ETVKRGSTVLGIACDQGIVLAAEERPSSKLQDPSFTWKIFEIDEHVGAAISGLSSDARILVDRARIDAQSNRLTYDEPIDIEALSKKTGDIMQLYTQHAGVRPFGVTIIFGGVDKLGPHILQADPSGACWKYKAVAIGVGSDTVREILEAGYKTDFQLEDAVTLAVKCLTKVAEGGIVAENLRIVVIPTETKKFARLSTEDIAKHISKIG